MTDFEKASDQTWVSLTRNASVSREHDPLLGSVSPAGILPWPESTPRMHPAARQFRKTGTRQLPATNHRSLPNPDQPLRFCARRLASRRRLVVLGGASPGGGLAGLVGREDSSAGTIASAGSVSKSVTGFSGRNKSALGSSVGVVCCFERTWSRRASRAAKDSSASGVRGTPCQKRR